MPKEEWGVKRVCPSCSVRFYDLQQDPMTCPNCSHSFTRASLSAGAARTTSADAKSAKQPAPVAKEEPAAAEETEGDDLDEEVLEEDSDDNVSLDDIADVGSGSEEN